MITIDAKSLMGDKKFHTTQIDAEEFKSLVADIIADTHPDDDIVDFTINNDGIVEIKLASGEELEIEVDWNEIMLK